METSVEAETGRIQSAVIGLGMNVNTDHFPEELEPLVTSLKQMTQKTWSRTQLLSRILVWLMRLVPLCETETGRQEIDRLIRSFLYCWGKPLRYWKKGSDLKRVFWISRKTQTGAGRSGRQTKTLRRRRGLCPRGRERTGTNAVFLGC